LVTFVATDKSHSHQPAQLAAKRLLNLKFEINLILRAAVPGYGALITGGRRYKSEVDSEKRFQQLLPRQKRKKGVGL